MEIMAALKAVEEQEGMAAVRELLGEGACSQIDRLAKGVHKMGFWLEVCLKTVNFLEREWDTAGS